MLFINSFKTVAKILFINTKNHELLPYMLTHFGKLWTLLKNPANSAKYGHARAQNRIGKYWPDKPEPDWPEPDIWSHAGKLTSS